MTRRPLSFGQTPRNSTVLAVVAAVLIGWLLFAPPQLGGQTTYVVIAGNSMEPKLHRGDLVLLRVSDGYAVGDSVGYRSSNLGEIVLHRIVRQKGDRYVFKGDNNPHIDAERPRSSDLVGTQWIRIPAVGRVLELVRTPRNAAVLAGLFALLFAFRRNGVEDARRLVQRRPALTSGPSMPSLSRSDRETALLVTGGAAAVFALVALLAFTRAPMKTVPAPAPYTHTGAFSYGAKVEPSSVYPDGRVRSGEPAYLALTDSVDVRFRYNLDALSVPATSGTGRLLAIVTDGAGWRRTLALSRTKTFVGGKLVLTGRLDLRQLRKYSLEFEKATGVLNDSYRVILLPKVKIQGSVGGHVLGDSFAPPLYFRLDDLRLQVEDSRVQGGPPNTLERSRAGSATHQVPATLKLVVVSMKVHTARVAGFAGLLASFAVLAAIGLLFTPRTGRDEPSRIQDEYGELLIPVAARRRPSSSTAVRVATMDSLVRVAEQYGRVILHEHQEGLHTYLVEEGGAHYFYEARVGDAPVLETKALGGDVGTSGQNELESRRIRRHVPAAHRKAGGSEA